VVRRTLEDLEAQQHLVSLPLAPLDRNETIALVHALARTGSAASALDRLGEAIWRASEGNPFMVVETIRAFEQGVGDTVPGPLALPERVRRVITARLERLGPLARELTAVAAVIGRAFDFPLLQRAAGVGEAEAAAAIEELVRRRVLHEVGERFDFTHDRIRDVAYDEMLVPRRKLLHRHVAEAIEALCGADDRDPHAFALARHYREVGAWAKAVTYFRQAAASAVSRSGYQEGVTCLEQALEALNHLPGGREALEWAVDIRLELRTALYPLGELQRTLAYLREAQPLAEQLGDDRRLGRVSAYLCVAFRRLGDFEGAVEAGERTLSLAAALDDLPLQVVTTLYLGQALWFAGAGRRAVDVFRKNVTSLTSDQLRQRFGAPGYPGVFSMTDMGAILAELGEFAEAKSVGEQGLAVAEELAQPFTSIAAHLAVANVYIAAGEFAKAIAGLERARSLCDPGDFPVQRIALLARLGYAYAFNGPLADGLALLEEASQQVDRIDRFWQPRLLGWLSEGYLLAGRVEDAARVAERARKLTPRNAPGVRAWMLRLAGEVTSPGAHVDVERAAGHYREAAALAEALELRLLRAHCHLGLGRLYRLAGDPRARAELSSAVDGFRAMGVAYWLSIAESERR
jgi:tetratricopeptide (TPR) repeat protein